MNGWGTMLRRLDRTEPYASISDAHLLQEFLQAQNAQAFEGIVRRHGNLVWRQCQRELLNATDAEDAFQATFLTLAQKAQRIRLTENLAAWLGGVAQRIARRQARQQRLRRQRLTKIPAKPHRNQQNLVAGWWEEERRHLPLEYQTVIELCLIQGLTREEAAIQLGQSPAAVHGLLYRARLKLKKQLVKHGTVAQAGWLTTATTASAIDRLAPLIAQAAVKLSVKGTLLSSVTSPGVMAMMSSSSISLYAAPVLVACLLCVSGLGWWTYQSNLPVAVSRSTVIAPTIIPTISLPIPLVADNQPSPPGNPGFWQTALQQSEETPLESNKQQVAQQPPPRQQAVGGKDQPRSQVSIPVPPATRVPSSSERLNLAQSIGASAGSLNEGMVPFLPHVSKQSIDGKPFLISIITSEKEYRACTAKAPQVKYPPNVQVMNDPAWDGGLYKPDWTTEVLVVVVVLEPASSVTLSGLSKCWIPPDTQGIGHLLLNYDGPEPSAMRADSKQYPYVMLKVSKLKLKQVAVSIWRAGVKPDGVAELPR